jgi:hypothetical protein
MAVGALMGSIFRGITGFVSVTFKKLVFPLIPVVIYAFVVICVLSICLIISGVGGSLLFYVIVFLYIKALFDYNPILEAKQQAEAAAAMNEGGNAE